MLEQKSDSQLCRAAILLNRRTRVLSPWSFRKIRKLDDFMRALPRKDPARYPNDHPLFGHILKDDGIGRYEGVVAHSHLAQNGTPRSQKHVISNDGGSAVHAMSYPSQGDAMANIDILTHLRGWVDPDAAPMLNKQAIADVAADWNPEADLHAQPGEPEKDKGIKAISDQPVRPYSLANP
jgi:hypothetical protein